MKNCVKWVCLLGSGFTLGLLLYLLCYFPEKPQCFPSLQTNVSLCPSENEQGGKKRILSELKPALFTPIEKKSEDKLLIQDQANTKSKPVFYLIIDDVGREKSPIDAFLDLTFPITFAIIPHTKTAVTDYKKIIQAKQEAILHMPMQPLDGSFAGKGQIELGDKKSTITKKLQDAFSLFPSMKGFNNHMGSAVTSSLAEVNSILDYVRSEELFFIDSYTTAQSLCSQVAEEKGIKIARRDIFLDNVASYEAVSEMLEKALHLASKNGQVVVIGHAWCGPLIQLLKDRENELKRIVDFQPISHFFERKE